MYGKIFEILFGRFDKVHYLSVNYSSMPQFSASTHNDTLKNIRDTAARENRSFSDMVSILLGEALAARTDKYAAAYAKQFKNKKK